MATVVNDPLSTETPLQMLCRARTALSEGKDPQQLLAVAVAYRDKYARLVEEQAGGALLDGRASIYTGETYLEAQERWDAYRVLLLEELRGPDGGLH